MYGLVAIVVAFITVSILASCALDTQESVIAEQHIGRLSIFILAGQSNMSDLGILPQTVSSDERVYVFGNDYRWRLATEPVDDPTDQKDIVSLDRNAGFSPSTSFAFSLLEKNPELVIGLIPCAKGSSSIEQWQRDVGADSLYGSCLERAQLAAEVGDVAGVLFFQGETDALDQDLVGDRPLHPTDWDVMFSQMVAGFREDLAEPGLPVVYAQIGENLSPAMFPNWERVKGAQRTLRWPDSAMIITEDMQLQDDVHFTTNSYRIIGERFAEAMWSLMSDG